MASDQVGKVGMGRVGMGNRRTWLRLPDVLATNRSQLTGKWPLGHSACWCEADVPHSVDSVPVSGGDPCSLNLSFLTCKWDNDHTNHLCEVLVRVR